jgi:DNA-binding NarL/FixJ family response regulator
MTLEQPTAAIRQVATGATFIRPVVNDHVLRGLERMRGDALPPAELPTSLTKRELDVLRLMAGGYSNREIADALRTVEGTVKNRASSILMKLDVRDRTRAVLKALEFGYL